MPLLANLLVIPKCPHCNIDSPNLFSTSAFVTTDYLASETRFWKTYACKKCGGVVTASAYEDGWEIDEMFPEAERLHESIPDRAKVYLQQSLQSIHSPSGSIMLAASAIDSMLKQKGYIKGNLYSRINNAATDHLITNEMAIWAHEVRLESNEERHADETSDLPNVKDAKRMLDFAFALAEFLFVLPSRVNKGIVEAKV